MHLPFRPDRFFRPPAPVAALAATLVAALTMGCVPACAADGAAPPDGATIALDLQWRAREAAPGEAIRVRVGSPVPLASLSGRFLGHEVFLSPDAGSGSHRWSGWTMIGLDQQPTVTSLDVSGHTADGRTAEGTVAVTVVEKEFPEERLKVSSNYVEPPAEVQRRLQEDREELAEIYSRRATLEPSTAPFARPVPGVPTSRFGTRRFFNDKPRSPHPGLDLRAETGTPVVCSGDGTVVLARELYYSGNTVIVDHGGGLFTLYAHLSEIRVERGASISRGETLGLSGATGRVTGPHLHWGAKIGDRPFDPRSLLDPALFDPPVPDPD